MIILKKKDVPPDLLKFFQSAGWARGENCAERDWKTGCHVCRMVLVFREVWRVLRDDGVVWLNYGDSYSSGGRGGGVEGSKQATNAGSLIGSKRTEGIPDGNLVGMPWRVALALQADKWVLRQDIIWAKKSPMPESVRNRCTKSHEYIFLLAKGMGYFYDAEAIRENKEKITVRKGTKGGRRLMKMEGYDGVAGHVGDEESGFGRNIVVVGANKRSVWSVTSQGYGGVHFATFPEALITPCILAGTSEKGACTKCGAPWERVTTIEQVKLDGRETSGITYGGTSQNTGFGGKSGGKNEYPRTYRKDTTIGWQPTCECFGTFVKEVKNVLKPASVEGTGREEETGERDRSKKGNRNGITGSLDGVERETEEVEKTVTVYKSDIPLDEHPIRPCVVLDPFVGSGTTCVVALKHGRYSWGIDLSETYLRANAVPRIEGYLESVPALRGLTGQKKAVATFGVSSDAGKG